MELINNRYKVENILYEDLDGTTYEKVKIINKL